MKRTFSAIAFFLLPVIVIGGMWILNRDVTTRNREYPTQMGVSPAQLSQTENPVLPNRMTLQKPPKGTIARGFMPFHYGSEPEEAKRAGAELTNPFESNDENLMRGKYVYEKNCMVCHGTTGGGDGPIIPKFPNPPAFKTEASRSLADGELFHVITRGRNNMPPQESVLSAADRWKVLLYIRELQSEEQNTK